MKVASIDAASEGNFDAAAGMSGYVDGFVGASLLGIKGLRVSAGRPTRGLLAGADLGAELLRSGAGGGGAKLPMTMESVRNIAAKYGIDISDLHIVINKERVSPCGSTSPGCRITLNRQAFMNEEQLARTLAHEAFHVRQIRSGMGYPATREAALPWEEAAYAYENEWWSSVNGRGFQP